MTIVATDDTRNLEWRKRNVGSTLLQKMGWKEGQGIGKRSNTNTTALRALRRQEGLGLGAKIENQGGESDRSDHFTSVLKKLQAHHEPLASEQTSNLKSKSRSNETILTLAQNRVNAGFARKRREAKFGTKTAEDLACIFGDRDFKKIEVPVISEPESGLPDTDSQKGGKKRKKAEKKSSKKKKKRTD